MEQVGWDRQDAAMLQQVILQLPHIMKASRASAYFATKKPEQRITRYL